MTRQSKYLSSELGGIAARIFHMTYAVRVRSSQSSGEQSCAYEGLFFLSIPLLNQPQPGMRHILRVDTFGD